MVAVLLSPKKKAAFYHENHGMLLVENIEGEKGMLDMCVVARFGNQDPGKRIVALNWIGFVR